MLGVFRTDLQTYVRTLSNADRGGSTYDNESIAALKGEDRVRLRPSVIFGSDGLQGCQHSFFEILSNSIDEAREGYGDVITVRRFKDYSIEVEDHGRGIPLDYNNREKRWNWELIYCELYAGGKYRDLTGSHYEFSLGLNGLGACATQYASRWFTVTVQRDGYRYSLNFERGRNVGGLKKEPITSKKTGTIQRFLPDDDVFTDIKIPLSYFQEILRRQAVVNQGVRFILIDEESETKEEYIYPDGIRGYINELNAGESLTESYYFEGEGSGRDRSDMVDYRVKAEVVFSFNNTVNRLEYYHNSSWLEYGGSPDRAAKNAFTAEFDRQARQRDKYRGNEPRITFKDIEDSLMLIINSFSTRTSYENQTKKSITNRYIQEFLANLIRTNLEIWFIEEQETAVRALDQVLVNKRSRESAERQRINVRKKLMGNTDFTDRVKKFVDCRSRDPELRELYIVEGDSALGSCKMGRDAEFQAIIPVRGKILNCLKADIRTVMNSEIILNLLKVLGCGVELEAGEKHSKKVSNFDLNALRWKRVIICTDADVDGFQIRTLILTMFYRLLPTLIREGYVYIAETPLYEITAHTRGKPDRTFFAYDEQERGEILSRIGTDRITIQRSKGLGENEPEMMWETTMNPETRRLIRIMPEAPDVMADQFDLYLGENLPGRRELISLLGSSYMDQLDLA
ncbi:MAG: DNA topoisomerase [Clostridiaceae bacterium]|nr:DNA topoisomerase [Clostridiaceae bacterium]